ncbi:MAG: Gfo/Idh/MocA family oxidoreductase [Balneolaceae bacterium]
MRNYRWGILGTGSIACEFTKGLKSVPGAVLHSAHSRTYEKALLFADLFGFRTVHKELETFLNDPDVDIIYIATPNNLHSDHAIRCLEAGKHVLVEKPLALNVGQGQEIVRSAKRNRRFCMEAMWSRFMPVYREVRSLLKQRTIGKIEHVSAEFGEAMMYSPESRLFSLESGGGSLLDLGVYPISLALMLFGEPESITGVCRKAQSGVDTLDRISLYYKDGMVADLRSSFDCRLSNSIWIGGTEGSIEVPEPIYRPDKYRLKKYSPAKPASAPAYGIRDKLHQIPLFSRILSGLKHYLKEPVTRRRQTHRVKVGGNGYQHEAREVMRAVDNGETESEIMPLHDSLAVLKITDQLRREWGIRFPEIDTKMEYL